MILTYYIRGTETYEQLCKLFYLYFLILQNGTFSFEIQHPKLTEKTTNSNLNDAVSPMPGIVNKVLVEVGDKISAGDAVMIVIAMKMEVSDFWRF